MRLHADRSTRIRRLGTRFLLPLLLAATGAATVAKSESAVDPLIESHPLKSSGPSPAGTPLFEDLPASRTGISFQLTLPDIARYIHEMIHLSVYGGICAGDYDGDGLPDVYVTSPVGGNRLFRNTGDFRFEDVTETAGVMDTNFWGTGAAFVDLNNDGHLDIYACGYAVPNRLWINQGPAAPGGVRFVERASAYGLDYRGASMMMTFADIDRDGDLDAYLATTALPPPPAVKLRVEHEGERPVIPKELEEYWSLIHLPDGRSVPMEAGQFDHLFRNDGDRFVEITSEAGIDGPYFTLAAIWWDFDIDGWPDLYVANDFKGPDRLYRNNGDGTFTETIRKAIPHTPWSSMGTDIGDLNQDGLVDLMATDMAGSTHFRRNVMLGETMSQAWFLEWAEPRQYARNALYLNTGAGRMMEAAYQTGMAATDWTWAPRIEDFDNDGKQDVFFPNGMLRDVQHSDVGPVVDRQLGGGSPRWAEFWAAQPMLMETNLVFRNLGDLRFERVEKDWGLNRRGVSLGAATADFDVDGDLDLVVSNADAPVSVYRNHTGAGDRIRVRLVGDASNRYGADATVRISAAGIEQVRYHTLTRGWLSSSEPILHFGLGRAEAIDSLTVDWPSGHRQTFTHLPVNHAFTITEPPGPAVTPGPKPSLEMPAQPMFRVDGLLDSVSVDEPPFDDFLREPLLPRKLSARGGRLAWADVDGNGYADVYVAAAPGNRDRLFLRHATKGFVASLQPAIAANQDCEDAEAVFFDFDGDGDIDLFVAGGGVRQNAGHDSYRHRLYANDGHGNLEDVSQRALPKASEGAGCVAAGDVNGDGRVDLYLGAASIPWRYPAAGNSYLWVNQGDRFVDQTPPGLQAPGIVTDAIWSDATGDPLPELVLTTEWGPVRIYGNDSGTLVERTQEMGLSDRTGLWSSLAAGDLDRDGDVDYVVGNQGLNTASRANPHQPEMLFYGDLDGSGRHNLLRAYFIGEWGYPHEGLDVLTQAMPRLRERVPTYAAFGAATIEELFTMDRLRSSVRREANSLESGMLINEAGRTFRFVALPAVAQISPARDLALVDVNNDRILDLVIGQNDYSPSPFIGRMDGGVSMLFLGDIDGRFAFVRPDRSGIVIDGAVRDLSVQDLNQDGAPDLVFHAVPGGMRALLNQWTFR